MIIIKKKKKKPSQDVTVNNDLEVRHVYLRLSPSRAYENVRFRLKIAQPKHLGC